MLELSFLESMKMLFKFSRTNESSKKLDLVTWIKIRIMSLRIRNYESLYNANSKDTKDKQLLFLKKTKKIMPLV